MAKLYFKYGAMCSSKTASALMCRFNYVQKGMNVLLLKPKIDVRFKEKEVVSRIGLSAPCYAFASDENLEKLFEKENENQKVDVVIIDECQFCTKRQVEQLRNLTAKVPVLCYGLMTNFKTELFEGSKRLVELCDSLGEIKSICECGKKADEPGRRQCGADGSQDDPEPFQPLLFLFVVLFVAHCLIRAEWRAFSFPARRWRCCRRRSPSVH